MRPTCPRDLALRAEGRRRATASRGEHWAGYGVLAAFFASGHVLALRRIPSGSIGAPVTSVWHRDPRGRWTFYIDGEPLRSCARWLQHLVTCIVTAPIGVCWSGRYELAVTIARGELGWGLRLRPFAAGRLWGAARHALPALLWRHEALVDRLARVTARLLGAGRLTLTGRASNGQTFRLRPTTIWEVAASVAVLRGADLGPLTTPPEPSSIGGFALPRRPLLIFYEAWLEPPDARRAASGTRAPDGH